MKLFLCECWTLFILSLENWLRDHTSWASSGIGVKIKSLPKNFWSSILNFTAPRYTFLFSNFENYIAHVIIFIVSSYYYYYYLNEDRRKFVIYFWVFHIYWASLLGLSNWALVCGLKWDQKGTNKTLAPMGLWLFCQLLTSPKLSLIIFNITI